MLERTSPCVPQSSKTRRLHLLIPTRCNRVRVNALPEEEAVLRKRAAGYAGYILNAKIVSGEGSLAAPSRDGNSCGSTCCVGGR
jgi:hypothetical protein